MVDVVWLTYKDETIARGYWDQGMLEDLFARRWAIPGFREFVHHENDFSEPQKHNRGAIVVLPARHNAEFIVRLVNDLKTIPWCILMLTGDEESVFPYQELEGATDRPLKLWIMSPKPGVHPQDPAIQYLGSGYPPQAREELKKTYGLARTLNLFFSGQDTHSRRHEAIAAMKKVPGSVVNPTEGFTQGFDHEAYYKKLSEAWLAPAPSGPKSVDSFRLYEALEAGAIPVADAVTPDGTVMREHWNMVFGGPVEFPVVEGWEKLQDLEAMVARGPAISAKIGSWWELKKRDLAIRLHEQLNFMGVRPGKPQGVEDVLSIVMVTSPIGSHPSMEHIDIAMESIRSRPDLAGCEVFILCDGIRPEQEHYRSRYEEYVSRLLWRARNEWTNVYPIVFEEHTHQARMTREFLDREIMRTPLFMFVEHDTSLEGDIPFRECVDFVLNGDADVVRFHHETLVHPEHKHLFASLEEPTIHGGQPFVKTWQWSQRPHIASSDFYREQLHKYFSHASRTMIEDTMHGVAQQEDWDHSIYLFYPPENCKRSTTSDGRQADPKYDMVG